MPTFRPPECPKCHKSSFYYRSITDTYKCRLCPHAWPAKPSKKRRG